MHVGIEGAHLTVSRYEWLRAQAAARGAGLTFRTTSRAVEEARVVKDASEIAALREAARRLTPVVEQALAAVKAGKAEQVVAVAIVRALRSAGYERLAFDTIVASGPNGALPHHRAGDRVLAPGDLVVLDFGGVLDGYCCDLTRTVSLGVPSLQARQVYDAVYDAQRAAIDAIRPGASTALIDSAAREVLEARGLGAAFGHGTGHGLGLDVHEEPRIGRPRPDAPPVPVEPGMVFTIEPGAYLPGWGGVRIEDDVLVTSTGCEVLTSVPRELLAL
jgi:Xaa-Pro aminopeptidase